MKPGKTFWATVAAVGVIGGGIAVSMAATNGGHTMTSAGASMPEMGQAGTTTGTATTSRGMAHSGPLSDSMFIAMMIPHHESAIEMANLALTRADHTDVRTLAQGVVSAQNAEISQMRGWYRKWYGRDVPTTGMSTADMVGMGMGGDVADLQTATPFDRSFLAMMIPHHAGAVVMASQVLRSRRPELRRLGARIIAAQAKEIGQMQTWRETWYPPLG